MEKKSHAIVYSSSEEEEEEKDYDSSYEEENRNKTKVVLALEAENRNKQQQLVIQRLWSDDDEITLLEGVIDYYSCNKKEKCAENDTQSLYNHVKKFLQLEVCKSQVIEKIRRLKKKYHNNLKGRRGTNPTFSKAHDQKLFDLSKKIWGSGCENSNSTSAAKLFNKSHQGVEDFVVRHGMEMIEGIKKAELEERWKKLEIAQLELFLHRNELINDQAKFILDSMK